MMLYKYCNGRGRQYYLAGFSWDLVSVVSPPHYTRRLHSGKVAGGYNLSSVYMRHDT